MNVFVQPDENACVASVRSNVLRSFLRFPSHRAARVAMPVERMTDCFKHRKDVACFISLYLDMHAVFRYFTVKKARRLLPAGWLSCLNMVK